MIPFIFVMTILSIDWKRILVSLQMYLPINIWVGSSISALFHPFFRWAMPGTYRTLVEQKKKEREERERKREEAKIKRTPRDVEGGRPGEPREVTRFEAGGNEETPLTGRGFTRMWGGSYVEIPGYSA
jgi:hypothetical protein